MQSRYGFAQVALEGSGLEGLVRSALLLRLSREGWARYRARGGSHCPKKGSARSVLPTPFSARAAKDGIFRSSMLRPTLFDATHCRSNARRPEFELPDISARQRAGGLLRNRVVGLQFV